MCAGRDIRFKDSQRVEGIAKDVMIMLLSFASGTKTALILPFFVGLEEIRYAYRTLELEIHDLS
jgi:hypothetical protein